MPLSALQRPADGIVAFDGDDGEGVGRGTDSDRLEVGHHFAHYRAEEPAVGQLAEQSRGDADNTPETGISIFEKYGSRDECREDTVIPFPALVPSSPSLPQQVGHCQIQQIEISNRSCPRGGLEENSDNDHSIP